MLKTSVKQIYKDNAEPFIRKVFGDYRRIEKDISKKTRDVVVKSKEELAKHKLSKHIQGIPDTDKITYTTTKMEKINGVRKKIVEHGYTYAPSRLLASNWWAQCYSLRRQTSIAMEGIGITTTFSIDEWNDTISKKIVTLSNITIGESTFTTYADCKSLVKVNTILNKLYTSLTIPQFAITELPEMSDISTEVQTHVKVIILKLLSITLNRYLKKYAHGNIDTEENPQLFIANYISNFNDMDPHTLLDSIADINPELSSIKDALTDACEASRCGDNVRALEEVKRIFNI